MRAIYLLGVALAIPLSKCDDDVKFTSDDPKMQQEFTDYLEDSKASQKLQPELEVMNKKHDISKFFDVATNEISRKSSQDSLQYFAGIIDYIFKRSCSDYLSFYCFTDAVKEPLIRLSQNLRDASRDAINKEWDQLDRRNGHAITENDPPIKYLASIVYMKYARFIAMSMMKTDYDLPVSSKQLKDFKDAQEAFVRESNDAYIDDITEEYRIIRNRVYGEKVNKLPPRIYFVATFLPTFTFGNVERFEGREMDNFAKELNRDAPLKDELKAFRRQIELYARLFSGNEWSRLKDGLTPREKEETGKEVLRMAHVVISMNNITRKLFYRKDDLSKVLRRFKALFSDDSAVPVKWINELQILACDKKSIKNIQGESERRLIAMQNDLCAFKTFTGSLWKTKKNRDETKEAYSSFIEDAVYFNNIALAEKILEYRGLRANFALYPNISPGMLVTVRSSDIHVPFMVDESWHEYHIDRLRRDATGRLDPHWFPTRSVLQRHYNMGAEDLPDHRYSDWPPLKGNVHQDMSGILKLYSNAVEDSPPIHRAQSDEDSQRLSVTFYQVSDQEYDTESDDGSETDLDRLKRSKNAAKGYLRTKPVPVARKKRTQKRQVAFANVPLVGRMEHATV